MALLPLCAAACCREWNVILSTEEYKTGLYEAEQRCLLTEKTCEKDVTTCIDMTYQLKKRADGACIHLDDDSRCSIYENRPKVCRDFTCKGGWRLASVFPVGDNGKTSGTKLEKEAFIECLIDDMTFVSHPLIKLHTVFYLKAKGEIVFVKEMVSKCGKFYTIDSFHYPQLDDGLLIRLIHLFDSKENLKDIRQRFCDQHAVNITKREFYEIVWLLNKHNIVMNAKNFSGMLGGMGWI